MKNTKTVALLLVIWAAIIAGCMVLPALEYPGGEEAPGDWILEDPEPTPTPPEVIVMEDTTDSTHQEMLISDDGGLTWTEVDCGNSFRPRPIGSIFLWHNAIYWVDSTDEAVKRYDGISCVEEVSLTSVSAAYPVSWVTTSDDSTLAVMVYDQGESEVSVYVTQNGTDWTQELVLDDDAACEAGLPEPGGMNRDGSTIYAFAINCSDVTAESDQDIKHAVWTSTDAYTWSSATVSGDFVSDVDGDYYDPDGFVYLDSVYYAIGVDDLFDPSETFCRIKSSGTWTTDAHLWDIEISAASTECISYSPMIHPAPAYSSIYGPMTSNLYRSTGGSFASALADKMKDVRVGSKATPGAYALSYNASTLLYGSTDGGTTWNVITPAPQYSSLGVGDFATPTPTPSPTPTAIPTATPHVWITEILARPLSDWNLRGGAGNNDQYVELGTASGQSLGGYQIKVYEGTPTP